MTNSNRPKWLDVVKLKKAAGKEAEHQNTLHVNLPVHSHKVIATYICPQCKLQYTSSDVERQVKNAARKGIQYIECPKCGGALREGRTAVVKDLTSIVNRADKYNDSNRAPSRNIDTWVDKAIYGRMVQKLGEHIQQFGINNPQLKFQRGVRAQKFPGQPKTAKGAEFTVEFVDFNNTRNRIVVQAGLTVKGELIFPRTFKTLSGTEYPLTKQAIDDFTSGKLYGHVMSDATIRPLTYRYPDPTRFREISAGNSKMQKKAQNMDPAAMDEQIQNMGVTDLNDIQTMKDVILKYQATPAGSTPIGAPPAAVDSNTSGGAFMNGVGLSSKLNLKKKAEFPIYEGMQESDPETGGMDSNVKYMFEFDIGIQFPEGTVQDQTQSVIGTIKGILGPNAKGVSSGGGFGFRDVQIRVPGLTENGAFASEEKVRTYLNSLGMVERSSAADTEGNYYLSVWNVDDPQQYMQDENNVEGPETGGVGLSSKLNLKKKAEFPIYEGMQESDPEDYSWEQIGHETLYAAVADGLAFPEAYDAVRTATQGNALITQAEFETMGQILTDDIDDIDQLGLIASRAAKLIKQAEIDTVKYLYKTAEMVRNEFLFDNMNSVETNQWINTYTDIYNKSLDNGDGLVEASRVAHKTAADILSKNRIKLALRDKDTLVPLTDPDPDYSIATTDEFEAEFGGKYEDTDGGILPVEDREYTTMFKGSSVVKTSAYKLTPSGDTAMSMLSQGQALEGFDPSSLLTVLSTVMANPSMTVQDLMRPVIGGPSPYQLEIAFNSALSGGYIEEVSENPIDIQSTQIPPIESSKLNMQKKAESDGYVLTPEGQDILARLTNGELVAGPNSKVLHTVLRGILDNPTTLLEEMAALYGGDIDMLRQAAQYALTVGYIDISSESALQSVPEQESFSEALANINKIEKDAEATGLDLDADEVGQNPINYSRLKGQIQDLLRAGNIPPSKVDMHKLKDGGYSLDELRNLIDTFKVNKDTFFPTAHAKIDDDQIQKSAEEKLSDLFKQMPLEKDEMQPSRQYKNRKDDKKLPPRRPEICPNKDEAGNIPPRQYKNRRDTNA